MVAIEKTFSPHCRPPPHDAVAVDAVWGGADGRAGARGKAAPSDMADFAMPPAGKSLPTLWMDNSSHAADHAAAGDFQVRRDADWVGPMPVVL